MKRFLAKFEALSESDEVDGPFLLSVLREINESFDDCQSIDKFRSLIKILYNLNSLAVENNLNDGDIFAATCETVGELLIQVLKDNYINELIPDICSTLVTQLIDSSRSSRKGIRYHDKVLQVLFDPFLAIALTRAVDIETVAMVLKVFNSAVTGTSVETRTTLANKRSRQMNKLFQFLRVCGDYDLQVSILELMYRLTRRNESGKALIELWMDTVDTETMDAFISIGRTSFDVDVRVVLLKINDVPDTTVHSIPCKKMEISGIILEKPNEPNYTKFWIDFNEGSKTILVNCNCQGKASSEMWDALTVRSIDVASIKTAKVDDGTLVVIALHKDAQYLFDSSSIMSFPGKEIKILFEEKYELDKVLKKIFGPLFQDVVQCSQDNEEEWLPSSMEVKSDRKRENTRPRKFSKLDESNKSGVKNQVLPRKNNVVVDIIDLRKDIKPSRSPSPSVETFHQERDNEDNLFSHNENGSNSAEIVGNEKHVVPHSTPITSTDVRETSHPMIQTSHQLGLRNQNTQSQVNSQDLTRVPKTAQKTKNKSQIRVPKSQSQDINAESVKAVSQFNQKSQDKKEKNDTKEILPKDQKTPNKHTSRKRKLEDSERKDSSNKKGRPSGKKYKSMKKPAKRRKLLSEAHNFMNNEESLNEEPPVPSLQEVHGSKVDKRMESTPICPGRCNRSLGRKGGFDVDLSPIRSMNESALSVDYKNKLRQRKPISYIDPSTETEGLSRTNKSIEKSDSKSKSVEPSKTNVYDIIDDSPHWIKINKGDKPVFKTYSRFRKSVKSNKAENEPTNLEQSEERLRECSNPFKELSKSKSSLKVTFVLPEEDKEIKEAPAKIEHDDPLPELQPDGEEIDENRDSGLPTISKETFDSDPQEGLAKPVDVKDILEIHKKLDALIITSSSNKVKCELVDELRLFQVSLSEKITSIVDKIKKL